MFTKRPKNKTKCGFTGNYQATFKQGKTASVMNTQVFTGGKEDHLQFRGNGDYFLFDCFRGST